ncbi:MarR family transcriptional regulator [Cellulomonas sp. zg-ZUI188]|uniref:MarR family transcriptional regulator n=1 Tax=Cellulomonas fengjieae TaxID=2819978 RepID=A0ABS3SE82_9CELL|nr:MarR family transcriptional regulator [Cellulomonas fengjieae]QVI64697.1 MarR family transcriptional regulator [Cellulomonas fengjieae]
MTQSPSGIVPYREEYPWRCEVSSPNGARIQRALRGALVNAVLGNERIAREFDLLVTDLQTLHLLVLRDDVRTPKQLSQTTGLPTSTITRVLDRLEAAGYLRRAHDPQDRRRINIELIPEKIAPIINRYGQYTDTLDRTNAEFTEEELGLVARYLEQASSTF